MEAQRAPPVPMLQKKTPMRLHYDLADLRLFLILMRTRSLSAAGEEAYLTTSAVSLRLKKLEDGIGAALFERRAKGLVPTEAGAVLAARAQTVLGEAAALEAHLSVFSSRPAEPLRIFSNSAGLQNYLCRLIGRYLTEHSEFRCVLSERRSSTLAQAVLTGEADLGLAGGLTELPEKYVGKLRLIPFVEDRHVLVLARNSPEAQSLGKGPLCFAETLHLRFASLSETSPMTTAMRERAAAAGFRFEPVIEAPSFQMLIDLVAEGALAAVVPASALEHLSSESREALRAIDLQDAWAKRPLSFLLPLDRPEGSRAEAFVDFALGVPAL